ncbi:MAG TPA: hypothetical protein VJ201_04755 [Candidatus Babeliales bacterium]|nr:hypothetical protein [Candidatus Babeliales bacterium]
MKNNLKKVVTLALLMSLMSINGNLLSMLPRVISRAAKTAAKPGFGEKVSNAATEALTRALSHNSSQITQVASEASTQALRGSSEKIVDAAAKAAGSSAGEAVSQNMRKVWGSIVMGFSAVCVGNSAQFQGMERRLAERPTHSTQALPSHALPTQALSSSDQVVKDLEETTRLLNLTHAVLSARNVQGNPNVVSATRFTLPNMSLKNLGLSALIGVGVAGFTTLAYKGLFTKNSVKKSSVDSKPNLNNLPQSKQVIVVPTEITRSAVSTAKKSKKKAKKPAKKRVKKRVKKTRKSNNPKKKKYAIIKAKNPRGRIVRSGN